MGLASEMNALADRLVEDRRQRKEYVLSMQKEVKEKMGEVRRCRDEMGRNLRGSLQTHRQELAEADRARLRDFKGLHSHLHEEVTTLKRETQEKLAAYKRQRALLHKELEEFSAKVHGDLVQGRKNRLADFRATYFVIEGKIKALREETDRELMGFNSNRRKMAATMHRDLRAYKEDLSGGERERREAFRVFLAEVRKELYAYANETRGHLSEYREDRGGGAAAWQRLINGRKPGVIEPQVVSPPPVAEEEPPRMEEPPVEIIEEELKNRVLQTIESRPDGIKLVEIEELVGVARIRIANIVKSLIDEGKVWKEGLLYSPQGSAGDENPNA